MFLCVGMMVMTVRMVMVVSMCSALKRHVLYVFVVAVAHFGDDIACVFMMILLIVNDKPKSKINNLL